MVGQFPVSVCTDELVKYCCWYHFPLFQRGGHAASPSPVWSMSATVTLTIVPHTTIVCSESHYTHHALTSCILTRRQRCVCGSMRRPVNHPVRHRSHSRVPVQYQQKVRGIKPATQHWINVEYFMGVVRPDRQRCVQKFAALFKILYSTICLVYPLQIGRKTIFILLTTYNVYWF